MDVTKWFNEQKIEPVQDRKDGMDYWKNYELFTWNDVTECLEALKELCEGKKAETGEKQCNLPVVSGSAFTKDDLRDAYNAGIDKGSDDIDKPTVNVMGKWSSGMFDDWFDAHYR